MRVMIPARARGERESDFDFDSDELVDNLDELELSDEDSDIDAHILLWKISNSIDIGFKHCVLDENVTHWKNDWRVMEE